MDAIALDVIALGAVALGPQGSAVGCGPPEPFVVGDSHGPAVAVCDAVVVSTEAGEVFEVGGSAVFPVQDVVRVGPSGWSVASWEHASAVALSHR